jgi:hypothetical protein
MSYDLCFWKQAGDAELDSRATYIALIGGQDVAGVEPFPIDEFADGVDAAFPGVTRERRDSNEIFWLDTDGALLFEMSWSDAHVFATVRPLDESVANRLIDIGVSVGAALYDPQVDERFALR